MNSPNVVRLRVRLAIPTGLVPKLASLGERAYASFRAAKDYAEAILPRFLEESAIREALFVILGDAMLVVKFDPKSERLFIAGFFIDEFDPPPGPGMTAIVVADRPTLVRALLARLGKAGAANVVADFEDDGAMPTDLQSAIASALAAPVDGLHDHARGGLGAQPNCSHLQTLLERRPRLLSSFFGQLCDQPNRIWVDDSIDWSDFDRRKGRRGMTRHYRFHLVSDGSLREPAAPHPSAALTVAAT